MTDRTGARRPERRVTKEFPEIPPGRQRRGRAVAAPTAHEAAGSAHNIYELEIELTDIKPRIWRRLAIPGSATLAELHRAVQVTMGWFDLHLHQFIAVSGQRYAATDPDVDPDGPEDGVADAHGVVLQDVLRTPGACLLYEYDFGDGWTHRIELVQITSPSVGDPYPRCLAGERSCPPEDSGGPGEYEELIEALADPNHERHAELQDWVGPYFHPEEFSIDEANVALRGME